MIKSFYKWGNRLIICYTIEVSYEETFGILEKERKVLMEIGEGLKKIFLAGVGAVATTAESAKEIVDTLVKKGEITVEQGKVLNEELKRSAKEKVNDHVTVNIVKEYRDAMKAVDHMTKEELDELKEKIANLERQEAEEAKGDDCGCEETEEEAEAEEEKQEEE
ncbi:phasin family protein [Lactonifactor sp. BIOML-A4]|uniref:phasin family protein n=1 Tax=unclassified Lactonifactor TaxID=2636670 RepID=UPI00325BDA29